MRLARFFRIAPAFGLLLAACDFGRPSEPWVPTPRHELTAYDYAVYSAWLETRVPKLGGSLLVDDQTLSGGYPGVAPLAQITRVQRVPQLVAPVTVSGAPPRIVGPRAEALQDFALQQWVTLPLERRFRYSPYDLVRDPVPHDLLERARMIVGFSRVGFDSKVLMATFEVSELTKGESGDWASAKLVTVWVAHLAGRWEVVEATEMQYPTDVATAEPSVPAPMPIPPCHRRHRHLPTPVLPAVLAPPTTITTTATSTIATTRRPACRA